jgi:hypothetical protein
MAMDMPGSGDVHVNMLMTNMSVGYINTLYIAGALFPTVMVVKRSDIIPWYTKSAWFRDEAQELSEREAAPISGYGVDTSHTYFCREYGVGHFIGDARRANTDQPFDADRDGTRWVTDKMLMKEERLWVNNFWKTGVWGTDRQGTVDFIKWSLYATSNPLLELRGDMRTIRRALGGLNANTLVLGDLTFDVLADHPILLDRIKYGASSTEPAMVTPNLIAQLLGLARVPVGLSMYTASPEGTSEGSVSYAPNWDDDAWLAYVAPNPGLFVPSAGYNFVWKTAFGGPRYIKRRRDPVSDKGDLVECYQYMDPKVIAADAGLFLSDAVD